MEFYNSMFFVVVDCWSGLGCWSWQYITWS